MLAPQAEREVSTSDGAEWARSKGMLFLEASAKTEKCIQQAFEEVVMKVRGEQCRAPYGIVPFPLCSS